MFDINAVQKIAFDHDFYELVILIEENQKAYTNFIAYGKLRVGDVMP